MLGKAKWEEVIYSSNPVDLKRVVT
jgi:hypothetical protein